MGNQNTTALQVEGDKRSGTEPLERPLNKTRELDNEAGDHSHLTHMLQKSDFHNLSEGEVGDQVNGNQLPETYTKGQNRFNEDTENDESKESIAVDKKDIQLDASPPRAMEEKSLGLNSNTEEEVKESANADDIDIDNRANNDKNSGQMNDAPWLDSGVGMETGSVINQQNGPKVEDANEIAPVSMINSNSDHQEEGNEDCFRMLSVKDLQMEEDAIPKQAEKSSLNENNPAEVAIQEKVNDISAHREDGVKVEQDSVVKAETEKSHADSGSHDEQDSASMQKSKGHHTVDEFVEAKDDMHKQLEGEETGKTSKHELIVLMESEVKVQSDDANVKQQGEQTGKTSMDELIVPTKNGVEVHSDDDSVKQLESEETEITSKHELVVQTENEVQVQSDSSSVEQLEGKEAGKTLKHELIVLTETDVEVQSGDPSVKQLEFEETEKTSKHQLLVLSESEVVVVQSDDPSAKQLQGEEREITSKHELVVHTESGVEVQSDNPSFEQLEFKETGKTLKHELIVLTGSEVEVQSDDPSVKQLEFEETGKTSKHQLVVLSESEVVVLQSDDPTVNQQQGEETEITSKHELVIQTESEVEVEVQSDNSSVEQLEGKETRKTLKHELIVLTESDVEVQSDDPSVKQLEVEESGKTSKHQLVVLLSEVVVVQSDDPSVKQLEGEERETKHELVVQTESGVEVQSDNPGVEQLEGKETGKTLKHELIVLMGSEVEVQSDDPSVKQLEIEEETGKTSKHRFVVLSESEVVVLQSDDPSVKQLEGGEREITSKHEPESEVEVQSDNPSVEQLEGKEAGETLKHELIVLKGSEVEVQSDDPSGKQLEGEKTETISNKELIVLTESEVELQADDPSYKQLEGEEREKASKHEVVVLTENEINLQSSDDPSVDQHQVNANSNPERKYVETKITDNGGVHEVIPEIGKADSNITDIEEANARENQISEDVKTDPAALVPINQDVVQENRDGVNQEESPAKSEKKSQIQKAPSFKFDFPNLTALEESDQTPLLFQRKAPVFRSLSSPGDVRFSNLYGVTETPGGEWLCKEKTINIVMERNELAKASIPLLCLEQGDDERCRINHHQEAAGKYNRQNEGLSDMNRAGKELVVAKGREIRSNSKTRAGFPSFLSSCICCTGIGQLNAADP